MVSAAVVPAGAGARRTDGRKGGKTGGRGCGPGAGKGSPFSLQAPAFPPRREGGSGGRMGPPTSPPLSSLSLPPQPPATAPGTPRTHCGGRRSPAAALSPPPAPPPPRPSGIPARSPQRKAGRTPSCFKDAEPLGEEGRGLRPLPAAGSRGSGRCAGSRAPGSARAEGAAEGGGGTRGSHALRARRRPISGVGTAPSSCGARPEARRLAEWGRSQGGKKKKSRAAQAANHRAPSAQAANQRRRPCPIALKPSAGSQTAQPDPPPKLHAGRDGGGAMENAHQQEANQRCRTRPVALKTSAGSQSATPTPPRVPADRARRGARYGGLGTLDLLLPGSTVTRHRAPFCSAGTGASPPTHDPPPFFQGNGQTDTP
uniref:nascent polypeptide-associated complex subunit alpha, muscle-specific form-like n=1 Tax=Jaculus jaculus TaxID=51337 RepID=UPI001E1B4A81|nr:nascent polypeptide-associated complex subunit alpha, muscle-specific form-like [Jaculus jaculus]